MVDTKPFLYAQSKEGAGFIELSLPFCVNNPLQLPLVLTWFARH
ncbi:hypothetical protein THZB04_20049 [Vibrio owensii]|nr:hypothetical protein THZB04_20049 [Vibrio owensii]